MPAWLIPAAVGAGSLLLDWLSGKKNQPGPLPAGSGPWSKNLTGGFGGGGGSSSTSTQNTSYNRTTTPFILPEWMGLMGDLRGQMEQRLRGSGLPEGYEDYGLRQINDTYRGGEQAVTNQLIGRGLLGSPAEATAFAQQFALPRMADMSQFRAEIPLKEREFKNEDWGMIMQLLDAFGKGQKEKGTSTTTTNSSSSSGGGGGGGGQIQPGVGLGVKGPGLAQNALSLLGFLWGQGAFGGGGSQSAGGNQGWGFGAGPNGVNTGAGGYGG